jgi:predicted RNA-binding Zn-ribbon protein involved in translation (DUF1610 family)
MTKRLRRKLSVRRQLMRGLSYFSLIVIWACLCGLCAFGVRVIFNLHGSTVYGAWQAIVIGFGVGTAITAPLAYLMLTGHRMRRRRMLGPIYLCRSCGYDLREAADSRSCPECGRVLTDARRSLLRVMQERGVTDADLS